MSFDGSFVLQSALERFLSRHPNLRLVPELVALSQKGGALTADELVASIADPFLHPRYTIPIMGCFRPFAQKIVSRAVSKLQIVPSLESESKEFEEEIGEGDIHVIDFYVGRGRGLRLHELASLAMCRALDLAPFLLSCVLNYFRFSPPPFRRLMSIVSTSQLTEKDAFQLLDAARISYRFLLMDPKVFTELWDWSCFLDIVDQMGDLSLQNGIPSLNNILDIRWCAIQILSVALRLSDRSTRSFGMEGEEAFTCFLRWEEFCQDTSLEKAGWYFQATELENEGCLDEVVNLDLCIGSFENGLSNSYMVESQRGNFRNGFSRKLEFSGSPFVLTSTGKKSFEMVLMAVSQRWPVLLHGPAGAGKTALVNRLANVSGNQVLFIHMDDQMDSKTLVGSYICSEKPGEFRWQPGSLTQAILNGFWVVFEDIDKAPNEVHSIILPLLEGSSSFATGHGEVIGVAESFRLFATVSTSKREFCHGIEGRFSFNALWRKVMVGTARTADMLDIVNIWYPNLEPFSSKLVDTFQRFNFLASGETGDTQGVGMVLSGIFNRFSIRDLLKWCKRISCLGLNISSHGLSAIDRQKIYQEAVDIFIAFLPSSESRLSAMREIARIWGMLAPGPENPCPPSKPLVQNLGSDLQVGRVTLHCRQITNIHERKPFIGLRCSLHVLERIACSVKHNEPVLLVGETGTGKTTLVQNLAMRLGQPLTVMNLSQQSDVADLLGGFKPTDARSICLPLYHEFKKLFCRTFSGKDNEAVLCQFERYAMEKKWKKLLKACQKSANFVIEHVGKRIESVCGSKRKRPLCEEILHHWEAISLKLDNTRKQIGSSAGMSFKFVEGAFITALRKGEWILLDEVNLAPAETLQRILGVLDGENGTLCLAERGDADYVERHPQFRIFACMNPATDAGKRELPYSLRNRLTEYFVDDVLDDEDLTLFVNQYLDEKCTPEISRKIVKFYKAAKRESEERLQDGANQKPQFSLRSLARALEYTMKAEKKFRFERALYDGFSMFFLTLLDGPSARIMEKLILSCLLDGMEPPNPSFNDYIYEKPKHQEVLELHNFVKNYVLTRSVTGHLNNLARAVFIKRYPVLLQGPTSSGKTSLVQYLATLTGHEFVRINNHEHTDLQEYLGSYVTDSQGKLQFQEGVLVKAVRNGHWIVLDELNLAPSDVLEALNRLLDDNREIFLPETQETVSAHPEFMLFATQNPPMIYGGRKFLSRAFRNRFLEIHVDEIPDDELITILERRCLIPASYAKKMVEVMKDLQLHRQNSNAFAGKHGFITPRDLFRWADRFRMFGKSYEDLAKDGYLLLAERLRDENEKIVVLETLQRQLKVKLVIDDLYKEDGSQSDALSVHVKQLGVTESFLNIVWTKSMWRLYYLVERCYKLREPVLLIGETGGGKTTVCQLLSAHLRAKLHILNCHQYTETSDFIGGFHPVRDRSRLAMEFKCLIEEVKRSKIFHHLSQDFVLSSEILEAATTIKQLNEIEKHAASLPSVSVQDLEAFVREKMELLQLHKKWQTIFLWQDGPLVQAMKHGDLLLVDEISLADDSVLERLNSVLEPERCLSLAEKGGSILEKITSHSDFFLLATMNPGGDYGKKELSPALRNRFTEIWVSPVSEVDELRQIARERFAKSELSLFADCMVKFWQWFNQLQMGRMLTVRDLLSWVSFINATEAALGSEHSFIHGAFLVLLDGLSLGTGISKTDAETLRENSLSFMLEELKGSGRALVDSHLRKLENYGWGEATKLASHISHNDQRVFGIKPFYIAKGRNVCKTTGFEFLAPTTCRNALRVLRAMQLPKPVLLEGSPGVGKTSLVVALAEYSGHNVVRINLSEQTDMMDLLGSDLPVEGENGMEFAWSDGILLQALKDGSWVLLDELNLAPQSVLEGLNAILDHRAEVYIPELGLTYKCPPSFRVFACQNPSSQGGGRKGLPKSFLNRFTKVYVDELSAEDYLFICQSRHCSIPTSLLSKLILFNNRLYEDTMLSRKYGQEGSPWEFNLRDVIRSCQIIEGAPEHTKMDSFLNIVYLQRMRTANDRKEVMKLYEEIFGIKPLIAESPELHITPHNLIVGSACIERNHFQPQKILNSQLHMLPGSCHILEAIAKCVQQEWLCILVGPSSSGKTSLIRLLAQLTGDSLIELNLSSGTDVSELLGCFEQYNSFRILKEVISEVERYVNEYFALRLELSWKNLMNERKILFVKWFAFLAASNYNPSMQTSSFAAAWNNESCGSLGQLIEIIEVLRADMDKFKLSVSWSYADLTRILKTVLDLQQNKKILQPAKFEWTAGDLIKAIEHGEWVVLDNANLCNPTVLDRINSLVEPDGSITVNERGLVDGKPMKIVSHPKFRMFLTMDPKHGEVSRAMRNRGLEIFMIHPYWFSDIESSDFDNSEITDIRRFLVLSGIPFHSLILAMSEAHIHAKNAGSRLGVRVTLLELSRWVQLFQQLLMKGNQPHWSLQLSWEHTYLSSLGEVEGKNTIEQAKSSYMSGTQLFKSDGILGCSLSLPGGWPSPNSVVKFVCYSEGACIRQNCVYLEFLGSQSSAYSLSASVNGAFSFDKYSNSGASLLPKNMVQHHLFPNTPCSHKPEAYDAELINNMLFFAANWTLEQATEGDFSLYAQWLKWFNEKLQPHCQFFESFLKTLDDERYHPIWDCVFTCRKKIASHLQIDMQRSPFPLLSTKLIEFAGSDKSLTKCKKLLDNAICCVPLLRLTYWQWKTEADYAKNGEVFMDFVLPVLTSLRHLESEVLRVLPESRRLVQPYSNLLQYHILFWKTFISSKFEHLSIVWFWLKKVVLRLQSRFPEAVGVLLSEGLNVGSIPGCTVHKGTPALWVHGGHPFMPCSADIYHKMMQLFHFCDEIWPRSKNETVSDNSVDLGVVLSANIELRKIAMQAVCMASCAATKSDQDTADIVQQLDDIYQSFLIKYKYEKENLQMVFQSTRQSCTYAMGCSDATCCSLSPEMMCKKSGFDSWMATVPMFDQNSLLLDINLLQKLSKSVLGDPNEAYQVLLDASNLLRHVLGYSLNLSSRSPTDFSPHQTILWFLDAWSSVDSVHTRIASLLMEMWVKWHSSLWRCSSAILKKFSMSNWSTSCHILQLPRTTILSKFLEGTFSVRDYDMKCLKLRVMSRSLWLDVPVEQNLVRVLLSAADALFKQIVFAHRKFFKEDVFVKIKATLHQVGVNGASQKEVQSLKELILSSNDSILSSLMDAVIAPLLEELYLIHQLHDSFYNLACAWVHIGVLRFNLLLNSDGTDPAMKYAYKHSIITDKLSLLALEIKVRKECGNLAGRSSTKDDEQERVSLLLKLEKEQKRLYSKLIFRPEPSKYKNFCSECADFLRFVFSAMALVEQLKLSANTPELIDVAGNWQITSSLFIDRLSEEYAEYKDLVQPVQVAVYEMKLGLSLALSDALGRKSLNMVDEKDAQRTLDTVYSLMRFPRELRFEFTPVYVRSLIEPPILDVSKGIRTIDISFLKKLATISSEVTSDDALQATVLHIVLIGAAHYASNSLLMHKDLFLVLNEIFDHFISLWMEMKSQIKVKEDSDAQYYRFRPRLISIEDIFEGNFSSLCMSEDSEGSLTSESEELLMKHEFDERQTSKENENIEEEWNLIPEYILKSLVLIHNQLFGSKDLIEHPGIFEINREDRLRSFMDSYRLGAKIMKDLEALSSSALDDSLMPEHVLHICLEYEQTVRPLSQMSGTCNIYKDANASVMFQMIEPLNAVQEKVMSLLEEWPDHPGLQNVLDVTNKLLTIPLSTPLPKALLGLQLLVSKAQSLQENFSRFSLADPLGPIGNLVSSWQKLELNCWSTLLDEVQEQHVTNAGKLWFPLHAVLRSNLSGDVESDNISTIQSVEEFIQTSSVGEFMKRLQLLLAFHGQLNHGICLQAYSSSRVNENLNVLYNAFGYYAQFIPVVLEYIKSRRNDVEKELIECLKLFNWEHSSTENFRRTRQKILKLVKKFNDVLQEPVMVILTQDAALKREKIPTWLEQKICDENNIDVVQFPLDLVQLSNTERFLWWGEWLRKANSAWQSAVDRSSVDGTAKTADLTGPFLSAGSTRESYMAGWKEGWNSLENVCRHAAEFAHLWKHGNKNLKTRRAFGDLLKALEKCGLSRHRSMVLELELKAGRASSSFLQPSYDVVHMLQSEFCPSSEDPKIHLPGHAKKRIDDRCTLTWEAANKYYFKNLRMVQQLRQDCLNFKKDLSLEQVNRAASFIDHLIIIQQEQRRAAYGVFEKLQKLRQQFYNLSTEMGYGCTLTPNQHAVLKCMWQQKNLFDSMLSFSKDMELVLFSIERSHKNTCDVVRGEIGIISALLHKFIPVFLQSKGSLDKYLLHRDQVVIMSATCMPFIVTAQMEQLVTSNFQVLASFEQDIKNLCMQKDSRKSVEESLLGRLGEMINKGKVIMTEFNSGVEAKSQFDFDEQLFTETIEEINELSRGVFGKIDFVLKDHTTLGELSAENITLWKDLFESYMGNLHLDHVYDALTKTIVSMSKLINCSPTGKPEIFSKIEMHLKHLHEWLDVFLTFGEDILLEFLDGHKTIAEMTHVLVHMFILLFSKGLGAAEEPTEDSTCDGSQDARGTGMGDGEGINDVSEQIEDESQLLGTSEKQDGLDNSEKVPSNKDKGIEMDDDFEADTFSVSEDSEDNDNDDEEDINLESKMGDTGDDKQVVDEKLWDKDEDDKHDDSIDKYESGPSVKETESRDRELRAKEDDAASLDESGELKNVGPEELCREDEHNVSDDENNIEDMNLDQKNAFEDQTGIQLSDKEHDLDEFMEEAQDSDVGQENDSSPGESDEETRTNEDEVNRADHMDNENSTQVDDVTEAKDGSENADDTDMDMELSKEDSSSDKIEPSDHPAPSTNSLEPACSSQEPAFSSELEMHLSNNSNTDNSIVPSRSSLFNEIPNTELSIPDSGDNSRLALEQSAPKVPEGNSSSVPKSQSNPYRSLGDALEEWKERVKVSVDSQEMQHEGPDDINEESTDEYRYVSEVEKATSQALGSATSDQANGNVEGKKSSEDEGDVRKKEEADTMDPVKESPDTQRLMTSHPSIPKQKIDKQVLDTVVADDESMEELQDTQKKFSGDIVSFKGSYMHEKILPIDTLNSGSDLLAPMDVDELPDGVKQKGMGDWKRYELATAKLSQELAEHLRLVMEPTLASKLQGDYRTGKRINMKKVIPYIASHYRKDKIWLRRTRPNKRDYQVVIAIDDSRSMSESHCGSAAVESLVTVCRAMSQLEVGQFAVASFGKKGNIKLLHEFDQPFTREAGVKMISSLSFKQDNTIADEPMVDLLKYLNNMLDTAVMKARLPSGQNPLHQLILIIADGRFHGKESLKRCVRNVLNRKRMVAFILLDSPKESIMDLEEVSFEGGLFSKTLYMNSFPFPYYILLKNMEALPRALADLLRQWFELMQSASE